MAEHHRGWMHLRVGGELDMGNVSVLEEELSQARTAQLDLILDISEVEFMDVRGAVAVAETIEDAQHNGWKFELVPSVSPQVRRLFEMLNMPVLL